MMMKKMTSFLVCALLLSIMLVLSGCAKEEATQEVPQEQAAEDQEIEQDLEELEQNDLAEFEELDEELSEEW